MENFNEYMYKSLVDIKELDLMIESYKPLTAAERFFMEADEEEKHEKVKKGIISKIKEVIKTIIDMIGKVLTFIKEKLMVIFADKDTKIKMEMIREKIKQNPELANAKIEAIDIYKWAKDFDKVMDELDDLDGTYMKGKMSEEQYAERQNRLIKKADEYVWLLTGYDSKETKERASTIAKSAKTAMSVDYALRMAETSPRIAKHIESRLMREEKLLQNIEKNLGEERTKEFVDEIHKLSSTSACMKAKRNIVRIFGSSSKGLWSATKNWIKDCANAVSDDSLSYSNNPNKATHMYGKGIKEKIGKTVNSTFKGKRSNQIVSGVLNKYNDEYGTSHTRKSVTREIKGAAKDLNEEIGTARDDIRATSRDIKSGVSELRRTASRDAKRVKDFIKS